MNTELIKKIAIELNKLNCTWAIGGSVLLSNYGLIKKPKDIFLMAFPEQLRKAKLWINC
jgi:hypothetical protein